MRMNRWALVIALVAGGCASAHQRQQQALEESLSWLAATSLAVDQWIAGRATSPYVRSTLNRAQENLQKLERDLPVGAREEASGARAAIDAALYAIGQSDSRQVGTASRRLRAARDALASRLPEH
jgi:hypothetical protein